MFELNEFRSLDSMMFDSKLFHFGIALGKRNLGNMM